VLYTLKYINQNPQECKRLLGLEPQQLHNLIEQGIILQKQHQQNREKEKVRIIRAGGGKAPKLTEEEQIILTLMYLRQHLTFQVLGLLFQVSESTANNIFHHWQMLFREGLSGSLLEQVKKSQEDEVIVKELLTEYELIIDSEEQARERPGEYQKQKACYSGKKKSHTFKNQVIVLPRGEDIVDIVAGELGPKSDLRIAQESLRKFHSDQRFSGDKAYQGESQIKSPQKKPKNGELNSQQKQQNKLLSSQRVFVEHVIRVFKIFRVAQERFRLRTECYTDVMMTIGSLVRLRIGALKLELVKEEKSGKTITVNMAHKFTNQLKSLASIPHGFVANPEVILE